MYLLHKRRWRRRYKTVSMLLKDDIYIYIYLYIFIYIYYVWWCRTSLTVMD